MDVIDYAETVEFNLEPALSESEIKSIYDRVVFVLDEHETANDFPLWLHSGG